MQASYSFFSLLLLGVLCVPAVRAADEPTPATSEETYDLKYKWVPGDVLRYQVEQLATVETTIRGQTQVAKSRSNCVKIWKVGEFDKDGNATFTHMVDEADMWQQVTGRAEVTYNSRKDEVAPPAYAEVAKSMGRPLAIVKVNDRGVVVSRDNPDDIKQMLASNGQLLVPLPNKPITIGTAWHMPSEVPVRMKEGGGVKQIKIRLQYKLERVAHGLATISVLTQVITPVDDGAIKSQLVQRLSSGTVKFDMDAGRVTAQELTQDETVLAFSGADSNMQYLARFTEKLAETTSGPVEKPAATISSKPAGPALPK